MKRFLSLLIAMVLLVSMFALPTFALADGNTTDDDEYVKTHDVGFDLAKFEELVIDSNKGLYVKMGDKFTLNQDWLKSEESINALFKDIVYHVLPEEPEINEDEDEKVSVNYYKTAPVEDPDADADDNKPVTEELYPGQHVTLKEAKTFAADSGYEFVGWLVPVNYMGLEEKTDLDEYYLYRAGDKFVMPDHDIDVVAYWYPVEVDSDDATDGDDATEPTEPTEPETPKEVEPKKEFTYTDDIICLEYITPSDDPKDKDDWKRVAVDKEITLSTAGWWMFRYVVIDGASGDIENDDAVLTPYYDAQWQKDNNVLDEKKNVFHWEYFCLYRYAVDTDHPEVALSSSMQTKMNDGLTVGTNYTILTSLSITDSSGTSVTYKVYRSPLAKGFNLDQDEDNDDNWKLIYDSTADTKVVEGYEDYITSAGVIKPQSNDKTESVDVYRYKIVYSVKDNNGYFGVEKDTDGTEEYHPTLYLGVKLSPEDQKEQQRMETWKIVLFVIAGLAAVGIVVLLCIKPKDPSLDDARVSEIEANNNDGDGNDNGTNEPVQEPVEEPVAEEPVVEEPAEEPVVEEQPVEEPVVEQPVEEPSEKSDDAE